MGEINCPLSICLRLAPAQNVHERFKLQCGHRNGVYSDDTWPCDPWLCLQMLIIRRDIKLFLAKDNRTWTDSVINGRLQCFAEKVLALEYLAGKQFRDLRER